MLQDHTLGELPVQYTTDFLTTIAAHYNTFSAAAGNISDVSFRLPPGLADSRANTSISDSTSSSPRSQCMQVHSMVFRQSPFPSHHAPRPDVSNGMGGWHVRVSRFMFVGCIYSLTDNLSLKDKKIGKGVGTVVHSNQNTINIVCVSVT